jgi:hypothetical protein
MFLKRKYIKKMKLETVFILFLCFVGLQICSQNPIVPNKGLNDPHIHVFKDTAYVYASHDKSITNKNLLWKIGGFGLRQI